MVLCVVHRATIAVIVRHKSVTRPALGADVQGAQQANLLRIQAVNRSRNGISDHFAAVCARLPVSHCHSHFLRRMPALALNPLVQHDCSRSFMPVHGSIPLPQHSAVAIEAGRFEQAETP